MLVMPAGLVGEESGQLMLMTLAGFGVLGQRQGS